TAIGGDIMKNTMLGAIIGDIVGSRFEFDNIKTKNFDLFAPDCEITDDSIMTIGVIHALIQWHKISENNANLFDLPRFVIHSFQEFYQKYPYGGYGLGFSKWLRSNNPQPYNSYGNGACMRVSPCSYISDNLDTCLKIAEIVTSVSHNHPIAIEWAARLVFIIFNLKNKIWSKHDLKIYWESIRTPEENFTLDEIRNFYKFNETCQGTMPQAIQCVIEAVDFEDAIRNAISIGGDSDTLGAIVGSMAEPLFEIPEQIVLKAKSYIPDEFLSVIDLFQV
ncbi:MAG: ADP-ribosylglycohydrolase family protein, partial [Oscillospiraceae bacterium]|nr:ADP-ribosylglycohydrolase family protein [Oscillospiraceae bacterium]